MKAKKYQLVNSYFKVAKYNGLPQSILEIGDYLQKNGELPFNYRGNNWVYDAFCEKQKRDGVHLSQFLTPDETVDRMIHFARKYFTLYNNVLEPCCGTGQITKELIKDGYNVTAFDIDQKMVDTCKLLYPDLNVHRNSFQDFILSSDQIISNPPYELAELTEFLNWILTFQPYGGISILLLPKGFVFKNKPKKLVEILRQFSILEMEDMREEFARTKIRAEIVVLEKKWEEEL
ncbi:hypothetical protein AGMMS49525_08670 [Bacteroidia bacterium]|nr:hypothetical protein AGMMS49525_08670 [Bacteroidia bacterium]